MKMWFIFIMIVMFTIPALTFTQSLRDCFFSAAWSGQTDVIWELIMDGAQCQY